MLEQAFKDYLRQQARSLDSLLELTPAKNMFGEDVSDQWKRKKQTPEQKKAARMAKLDPANWKSAKDVYDERSAEAAKKRKRATEEEDRGLDSPTAQPVPNKKRKSNDSQPISKSNPTTKLTEKLDREKIQNKNLIKKAKKRASRAEKNQQKRERKEQAKAERLVATQETSAKSTIGKALSQQDTLNSMQKSSNDKQKPAGHTARSRDASSKTVPESPPTSKSIPTSQQQDEIPPGTNDSREAWSDVGDESAEDTSQNRNKDSKGQDHGRREDEEAEMNEDEVIQDGHSTTTSSEGVPDILSPLHESAASSVSSIIPPSQTQGTKDTQEPETESNESKTNSSNRNTQNDAKREAAHQRLEEKLSQFRAQRKADEKPIRSRAELLAQRRQKEQERKEAKKAQRRKEKEDDARRQDEEIARRFSPGGSGSLLASPRSPMIEDGGGNAFNFGRIAFEDGSQYDPSTGSSAATKKHKGPADLATALRAAQAKQTRIAGLDEQKRADIAEKDMWLNAKKRAHGERIKDDTSLLKKALKRQEKQKQRSEKEWDKRIEGVKSSQDAKQKKRTENLQKRRDEKLAKKPASGKKKVKRPGFEGSFRSRSGKSKK